jgi:hypothetical protein
MHHGFSGQRFRQPIARASILVLVCSVFGFLARSSSFVPTTTDRQIQMSAAIFRGTVLSTQSYEDPADGQIYTRTVLGVNEVFKGALPVLVKLIHRGGTLSDRGEIDGFAPQFKVGEERLVLASRRADGTLYATRGGASALRLSTEFSAATTSPSSDLAAGQALLLYLRNLTVNGAISGSDVTDQAASSQDLATPAYAKGPSPLTNPSSTATNLITDTNGIPARFILPDRAEPIPYLVDADYLPAGITQTQAVTAVQAALAAWANVTSLRYRFAGIQSFGMAPRYVTASDGVLRIQLHDHYNYITNGGGGDTLGEGGHAWTPLKLTNGWTTGGNVMGNDFHKVTRGYLVLQHTNVVMQTLSTFTEVLTHEIGHTIGLGHSSVNPDEPNPILKQAAMYFEVHADGRGAAVTNFDMNVSRQIHPPANTPPYCYDRYMDIVTSPTRPLNVPGVNSVQVRGYDLQTTNLTFAATDATTKNGIFSAVNSNITYVPNAYYSQSPRQDPAGGTNYDSVCARYSDGVNASPYVTVKVISFSPDAYSEGIPDAWRTTYFGSPDPSAGPNRNANDDFEGDGFSNVQEYLLGSDPTDRNSNLRITSIGTTNIQWQAKGYEVYELYSSTNLAVWNRAVNPIVPTNSVGTATGFTNGGANQVFRVQKVP